VLGIDWFTLILRAIHISGGVVWVGFVVFFVVFLQPSAATIGPAAGPMMGQLLGARKLVDRLLLIAGITIAAGLILWIDHAVDAGLGDWISSGYGLALTIGMVSALIAVGVGASVTRPNVRRLLAIQGEVATSGGPPSPEQGAEIAAIQARLKTAARVSLGFLIVTVLTMATAQNW
jgi:hypothetical protein